MKKTSERKREENYQLNKQYKSNKLLNTSLATTMNSMCNTKVYKLHNNYYNVISSPRIYIKKITSWIIFLNKGAILNTY